MSWFFAVVRGVFSPSLPDYRSGRNRVFDRADCEFPSPTPGFLGLRQPASRLSSRCVRRNDDAVFVKSKIALIFASLFAVTAVHAEGDASLPEGGQVVGKAELQVGANRLGVNFGKSLQAWGGYSEAYWAFVSVNWVLQVWEQWAVALWLEAWAKLARVVWTAGVEVVDWFIATISGEWFQLRRDFSFGNEKDRERVSQHKFWGSLRYTPENLEQLMEWLELSWAITKAQSKELKSRQWIEVSDNVITQLEEHRRIAGWESKELKIGVALRISENGRLILELWAEEHKDNLKYSSSNTRRQAVWWAAYEHYFEDGSSLAVWWKTWVAWNEGKIAYNFPNGVWVEARHNAWNKKTGTEKNTMYWVSLNCSFADFTNTKTWNCWNKKGKPSLKAKEDIWGVVARTNTEFKSSSTLHIAESKIEKRVIADLNALLWLIAQSKSLRESDYTPASWSVLAMALGDAENYLQNTLHEKKTQAETDRHYNNLKNAMDGLEKPIILEAPLPVLQVCTEGKTCRVVLKAWKDDKEVVVVEGSTISWIPDWTYPSGHEFIWTANIADNWKTFTYKSRNSVSWKESASAPVALTVEKAPEVHPSWQAPKISDTEIEIGSSSKFFDTIPWVTYSLDGSFGLALSLDNNGNVKCESGFPAQAYSVRVKAEKDWKTLDSNTATITCKAPASTPQLPTFNTESWNKSITVWDVLSVTVGVNSPSGAYTCSENWPNSTDFSNLLVTTMAGWCKINWDINTVIVNWSYKIKACLNIDITKCNPYTISGIEVKAPDPIISDIAPQTLEVWTYFSKDFSSHVSNPKNPTLSCSPALPAGLTISWSPYALTISWTAEATHTWTCTLSDYAISKSFGLNVENAPFVPTMPNVSYTDNSFWPVLVSATNVANWVNIIAENWIWNPLRLELSLPVNYSFSNGSTQQTENISLSPKSIWTLETLNYPIYQLDGTNWVNVGNYTVNVTWENG